MQHRGEARGQGPAREHEHRGPQEQHPAGPGERPGAQFLRLPVARLECPQTLRRHIADSRSTLELSCPRSRAWRSTCATSAVQAARTATPRRAPAAAAASRRADPGRPAALFAHTHPYAGQGGGGVHAHHRLNGPRAPRRRRTAHRGEHVPRRRSATRRAAMRRPSSGTQPQLRPRHAACRRSADDQQPPAARGCGTGSASSAPAAPGRNQR